VIEALQRCWYGRCPGWFLPIHFLLARPLSWLFSLLVWLRRAFYRLGWFKVQRLPVPVIVVGNLNVGGSGKTPLSIALVEWLRQAGFTPGIISRGYGGSAREPMPVLPHSDPVLVGDEPVLLARRTGIPLWIGRARVEAGRRLLAAHPQVDLLIADDGLQHLALARDVELVVVDATRGFGNGRMLPAGPLREPLSRLARVDAVVINGGDGVKGVTLPCAHFGMRIVATRLVNLADPTLQLDVPQFLTEFAATLSAQPPHAVAGIGNPERFFRQLEALGIAAIPHAFADHHAYQSADLPPGLVLMTEKDAVKCVALGERMGRDDLWFLAVDAEVDAGLQHLIIQLLQSRKRHTHGPQTA
jgi:tetraacyldisaccharide 4'-kinase